MAGTAGATGGTVLVTRPEPGASETAKRLRAMGRCPVLAPVMEIRPRRMVLPSTAGVQALLVTSGNAVPALPDAYHDIPLLAVGDATAARAATAGFTRVHSAGRDAQALAMLAASVCDPSGPPLVLASGARQGLELAADLRARGFRVIRRVAYASQQVSSLPDSAQRGLVAGDVAAILFFSPATARSFVFLLRQALAERTVARVDALAISAVTAAQLALLPWRRIRVASHPNQDALLALLT